MPHRDGRHVVDGHRGHGAGGVGTDAHSAPLGRRGRQRQNVHSGQRGGRILSRSREEQRGETGIRRDGDPRGLGRGDHGHGRAGSGDARQAGRRRSVQRARRVQVAVRRALDGAPARRRQQRADRWSPRPAGGERERVGGDSSGGLADNRLVLGGVGRCTIRHWRSSDSCDVHIPRRSGAPRGARQRTP